MQNRRNDKNQSELDRLMTIATDVVEGQLRQFGYTIIVLTMTTSTKATRVVTGDASIDLDTLATIFRLSCITEAARVGVVTYQVRPPSTRRRAVGGNRGLWRSFGRNLL